MKLLELINHFRGYVVFSLNDIRKVENKFDVRRLTEWQKKGYIKKIVRNFYIFSDLEISEPELYIIANKIYAPSYISFEMALSYYHLIPESVYTITSAATKKTMLFQTQIGNFIYRSIKPNAFFGYSPIPYQKQHILIANVEKALIDYFYLNSSLNTDDDFSQLRINQDELISRLNQDKLNKYLVAFGSKALTKRVLKFIEFIRHDDI